MVKARPPLRLRKRDDHRRYGRNDAALIEDGAPASLQGLPPLQPPPIGFLLCMTAHNNGTESELAMENWDEIRTAYQVARLGTVSGAAEVLGVHHATVIRHIDALERRLGTKLFQRHARGYTPTEAGRDLLAVAQATEEQFAQLSGRIKGHGETVQGEFVITSVAGLAGLLVPVLTEFQRQNPAVIVRLLTDMRIFRLDYGEAHVAIRAGAAPEEPDNVAQPLAKLSYAMYASKSYIERHGMPASEADFGKHRFIVAENEGSRANFFRWMRENIAAENLVFRSTEPAAWEEALLQGTGIGFLPAFEAEKYPDLVEVLGPREAWNTTLWIVTHVDLHRTRKVQAFVTLLKEMAKTWPRCTLA